MNTKPPAPYQKTPDQINSIPDLISFVKAIPAKHWCVDTLRNDQGQCCVLGHYNERYNAGLRQFETIVGIDVNKLAAVNNGSPDDNWYTPRPEGTKTDGASIKRRLLAYLKSLPS